MALVDKTNPKRTAARRERRQQLIDATMKCIAKKGMSSTTLSDVAGTAGLSQGIVNLHFESKDNLLNETLRYIADEYKTQFDSALQRAGPAPADKLQALMKLDLRPSWLRIAVSGRVRGAWGRSYDRRPPLSPSPAPRRALQRWLAPGRTVAPGETLRQLRRGDGFRSFAP